MVGISELTLEELSDLALTNNTNLTHDQLPNLSPEQLNDLPNLFSKEQLLDEDQEIDISTLHTDINTAVMEFLVANKKLMLPNSEPELNIIDMTSDEIKELTMDQINTISQEQINKLTLEQMLFLPVLPLSMRLHIASIEPLDFAEGLSQIENDQLLYYPPALAACLLPCHINVLTDYQRSVLDPIIHFGSLKLKEMLNAKLE